MKIIAIDTLAPMSPDLQQTNFPREVPATLQYYLDAKIEQFWLRDGMAGPIFLMSVDSTDEAHRLLDALPRHLGLPDIVIPL